MPETYEIAIEAKRKPKRYQRERRNHRNGHPPLGQLAALVSTACILAAFTMVMCVRAIWYEPTLPQQPPPVQMETVVEATPTPEPTAEPVEEKRYTIYDVPLSEELQRYTQDVCEEYGVSYPLVIALMRKESGFLPDTVSATNDYGIMQINQGNHEWLEGELGITDWFDPQQNILAGVYVLSQFNGYEDVHQVLMCYNCGPSGAKKLWAEGVYSTAYSRAVVEILNGLEVIDNTENP